MPTDLGGIDPSALPANDLSAVTPQDRLRDAFAQLFARGQGLDKVVSGPNLWQAQAMQQGLAPKPQAVPPPSAVSGMTSPQAHNDPNTRTPMPVPQTPPGPQLNFPTAPANPQNLMGGKPPKPEAPFHGKGQYAMPKSEKPKKGAKRG